ncbi:MAG: ATP-binding cassette domain-containing protein [Deltaproteobacteria bacterium]|nr:ATP-binding cassette domain-containing protein [Deltaproteobacteria bacterium]
MVDREPALAVRCRGLVKRYDDVVALAGLDLETRRGECFGLLGPNGAGKTTAVEILEGLIRPDGGSVEILPYCLTPRLTRKSGPRPAARFDTAAPTACASLRPTGMTSPWAGPVKAKDHSNREPSSSQSASRPRGPVSSSPRSSPRSASSTATAPALQSTTVRPSAEAYRSSQTSPREASRSWSRAARGSRSTMPRASANSSSPGSGPSAMAVGRGVACPYGRRLALWPPRRAMAPEPRAIHRPASSGRWGSALPRLGRASYTYPPPGPRIS